MSDTVQNAVGAFQRMNSRDQVLAAIMALVLALLAIGGISLVVSGRLKKADLRLNERREQLAVIEALEGRYKQAEQEQAAQVARLRGNKVQLFSLLNKSAHDVGLELKDLNERRTPIKEAGINEVSVDVTFKGLSITKLNKILEKLEGPPNVGLVKVTKLKARTSFTNPEDLDVTMTVCTYTLISGGASDTPEAPGSPP